MARRLASGRWQQRIQVDGVTHSLTRRTRQEAVRDGELLRQQLQGGFDPSNEPFGDYLTRWIAGRTDLRESTRDVYRRTVSALNGHPIMAVPLADVRPHHLQSAVTRLSAGRMATTVALLSSPLSHCLKDAEAHGVVLANPWRGIRLPKDTRTDDQKPGRILTVDEHRRLRDAAGIFRVHIDLLVTTGLRVGELFGLDHGDVVEGGRVLWVRRSGTRDGGVGLTKSGKGRRVPVPERLAVQLGTGDGPLFVDARTGGRWVHAAWVSVVWVRSLERAGIVGLRPHDLRHTAASWMLNRAGVDLQTVREIMGHSDVRTTARYLHSSSDLARRAADGMGEIAL